MISVFAGFEYQLAEACFIGASGLLIALVIMYFQEETRV